VALPWPNAIDRIVGTSSSANIGQDILDRSTAGPFDSDRYSANHLGGWMPDTDLQSIV
jgi:hypothetical protein